MQAFVGLMILRFVESKKQKEGKTNRSRYSGLLAFGKILNLWLSCFLTDHWHDHMIQAAPMQFLLKLDFLPVGKVSAICRACTRAPVHLVQFETGFRRRYHLERSRHFWEISIWGLTECSSEKECEWKTSLRAAPHCVQHPRPATSGRTLETHLGKSFSGSRIQMKDYERCDTV